MSTIITPSEEQINIVVNDEKISINVESGDVIVNVNEQIVEVSTVNGGYPLPTTVYSVFGRTGNIIATEGDYDLGELGDVTLVSSTNGDVLTYDGTKWINKAVSGTGTVTSVDMSVPVGLQVSGNPISTVGTLALNYAAGYSLPTTAKQTTWDAAYNDSIVSASVSGTTTKTLTLNQQDGGTITASWTDIDTNLVTSVNGYVGTVVLTTSDIAEGSRLYYTETRVSNNVDVAANTAARHSAVTIGTANGLSLASQVLSLALASASTTGALSSTDWATFNNKVPYSGATGNVTLGEYQLSAGQVAFDQSPTGTAGVGILRWNDSDGTLDLGLKGGNVTLQVGQDMVARVVNKTGADLLESGYKVVRISSAQGQRLAVQLAQANNDTNSTDTIGIVTETIANNQEGFITILGQVKEINTTGSLQGETWADGDVLYLSPTTAGNITNIKPVAPSHMVVVGYVEYAHSQHGKIYCKTQNGYELEELHNVLISSVANNEGLFYETSTSLWKNKSIATVLGYTPISLTSLSGVSPLSYNNTTGAFSIAQATTSANGYLSSTDWNTFNDKQAALNGTGFVKATGTTISYDNSTYYLASNPSAYIALTGLSATAPLSYNNTTGGFTISQAGVSGNGYLSSTDWNTFNNKQASGSYITALSGEATASGPGSAAVTLSTSAVTGKLLTGVNITGGSISATDSILVAFGKVQNQINGVLGGAIYQSVWNASTNSPTLTSGTGTKGYYYIVSVAGSTNLDGITDWKVGDWAIFNGTTWNKVDNSDAVSSVNGFTGAVSLTTANISEVTNLYYTDVRVSANTDVAANTAARHAAVTLGTANGLSLSTQQLSLGLASTSATGALSSTDWNIFNLKQAALSGTGFVKISGTTISYDNSTYYLASNPSAFIALTALSSSATGLTYTNTTGVFSLTAGYSIPTTANQTNWTTAYNDSIISAAVTGTTTKTLTLNQQDGGTITASWTDINTDAVTSVFGRTGAVVAAEGDYSLTQLSDVTITSPTSSQLLQYNGTSWVNWTPNYITGNQTITLSGDVSGSGTTAITTTIGALKVTNAMLAGSIDLTTKVTGLLPDGNISSAATWNAKQNALSGTGFVKISGTTISYDNSTYYLASNPSGYTTNVGTVTSVAALTLGTSGTDLSSSVANSTTTPVITLNVPTASATNRGALSSADWATFNGKQTALNGTGFVVMSGTSVSYDNNTYAIGLASNITTNAQLDDFSRRNGMYRIDPGVTAAPYDNYWSMIEYGNQSNVIGQLASHFSNGETYIRAYNTSWSAWRKLWDNVNLPSPQSAITLTTTGSSGASTFVSNTLNVPTYTLSGLGGQPQLNGTGFVKASGTTITYDNSTYLTGNQTITLSGDVSGSGATAISTTIGALKVTNAMLAGSIASSKLVGTDIATVGTITSGIWNGTAIADTYISSAATWNAKQAALSGTGFVKISGTTISYDNSTYLTTSSAASTYLPLTGGILTGALGVNISTQTAILEVGGDRGITWPSGTGNPNAVLVIGTKGNEGSTWFNTPAGNPLYPCGLGIYGSYSEPTATVNITAYAPNASGGYASNLVFSNTLNGAVVERMRITSGGDMWLKGRSTTANFQAVFYNANDQFAINATNTSTGKTINFNPSNTFTALSIASTGTSTLTATDISGNRTSPIDVLTITAENPNGPYDGFGGTLLFKNRIYSGGPSGGGIQNGARIRTSINTNSSVNYGTNLIFENTATGSGALQTILTMSYNTGSTFTGSVSATGFFSTTGCNFATSSGSVNINNTTNTTYKFSTYNNVEDTHVLIAGLAPSLRFADTVTGITYSSLFGMATIANNFITGSSAGDFAITWGSTKKCFFGYTNTTAIMVLDNGNLGLGTLTIGSKAQINGNLAVGYSSSTAAPTNGILSNGGFKSSNPTGDTAQTWKLGSAYSGTVTHTHYVNVEVNGVIYALLASNAV